MSAPSAPKAESAAFDSEHPSVEFLRERARRRMPHFAFEYLEGGCFSEVNLRRNTEEIREAMDRNTCRCGTYTRIMKAVESVAKSGVMGGKK